MKCGARWLWALSWAALLLLAALGPRPLVDVVAAADPPPAPNGEPVPTLPLNDRLGIAHISYGGRVASEERYRLAIEAGAGWNRWVAYWHELETAPGTIDYSRLDATVEADRRHGLQLNVVLMGTPGFYATNNDAPASSAPRNLDRPVFADGTDVPSVGKTINPENYWARFVSNTVARYAGAVRHWEIWNEPDFAPFWSTGDGEEVRRYARLLKVGYLAGKAANPDAQILLGGLMHWEWANQTGREHAWLGALLEEMAADASSDGYGYYFDVLPLHWYARSRDLYDRTLSARRLLEQYGLGDKRIWVNEANLGVCGDPRMGGKPDCTPGVAKGNLEEQASFVLQAIANSFAAGVERFFAFQLLDDAVKPMDYYGLVRNDQSRRPAYAAYQVAARYLRDVTGAAKVQVGPVELVSMLRGDGRLVLVGWNGAPEALTAGIPARSTEATLVDQTGEASVIAALGGSYSIHLPGATMNLSTPPAPPDYVVGGRTFVILETPREPLSLNRLEPTASPPTPSPTPTAPPTVAPTPTVSIAVTPTPTVTVVVAPTEELAPSTPTPGPADSSYSTLAERLVLPVPRNLSTLRITDVSAREFTVSWTSAARAEGIALCGEDPSRMETFYDVRGADTRTLAHFVTVRNRRPGTVYWCSATTGREVEDNGGDLFKVSTKPVDESPWAGGIGSSVLDEQGRPFPGAIVYALPSGATDGTEVRATLSDENGRWSIVVGGSPGSDDAFKLLAVGGPGLTAEVTAHSGDVVLPMRLRFRWSPY